MLVISIVNVSTFAFAGPSDDATQGPQVSLSQADNAASVLEAQTPCTDPDCDFDSSCPAAHMCHLGHCGFVMTSEVAVMRPQVFDFGYLLGSLDPSSADLSSQKKPPKA